MAWLRLLPVILFAFSSISMLTYEQGILARVAEVVQRWDSQVTYKYIGDGWVEFTDLHGKTFQRQVAYESNQAANQPHKFIVINVPEIDTTGFAGMFSIMATVPLGTSGQVALGYNGPDGYYKYVIGKRYLNGIHLPSKIYRKERNVDSFTVVHDYGEGYQVIPTGAGRFHPDNTPHLATDSGGSIFLYETLPGTELPITRTTAWYALSPTLAHPRQYDFDGDGIDEIVTSILDTTVPSYKAVVCKYDLTSHRIQSVFDSDFNEKFTWGSWAVGDFDIDGKGEFGTAVMDSRIVFVEYLGEDTAQYIQTFSDESRGGNGGFNTEGMDMDFDGKPEAFIGTGFFGGILNIAVYERIQDNVYEDSIWIEIAGVGALSRSLAAGDVDGDNIEELIVTYGGMLLILKPTLNDYKPFWMMFYREEIGVRLFDFDDDGTMELMVGGVRYSSGFADIYRFNEGSVTAEEPPKLETFELKNPYPQPADASTSISFTAKHAGSYRIDVYNSGGRRIRTIVMDNVQPGNNTSTLTTAELTPGLYFYTLTYKKVSKAGKFIVLR